MIREHEFNSKFWGSPVGIFFEQEFFDLSLTEQQEMLAPFSWVEFRAPLESAPHPAKLLRGGFSQADSQIHFRIDLRKIRPITGIQTLSVRSADEQPFRISGQDVPPFKYERYRLIPEMTQELLNERYVQWGNLLIEKQPEWCLSILDSGEEQGWFLSQKDNKGSMNLTLAMLKKNALINGALLYQTALLHYAEKGCKIGWASFSASNTPVLNIYAGLGARFLPTWGNWFWWKP